MGLMEKLGLTGQMDRAQIQQQIFVMQKKLVSRQNSPDTKKRIEAELLNEQVNHLDEVISQTPEDFYDIQLALQTFAFAVDADLYNEGFLKALIATVNQNWDAWAAITDFVIKHEQRGLWGGWMFMGGSAGYAVAFQGCGAAMFVEGEYQEAAAWYEKAAGSGCITEDSMYNWGMCYAYLEDYRKALEKFQACKDMGGEMNAERMNNWGLCSRHVGDYRTALEMFRNSIKSGEHTISLFPLGEMYEEGMGVPVDLQEALRLYEEAERKGLEGARRHIDRVKEKIAQKKAGAWNLQSSQGQQSLQGMQAGNSMHTSERQAPGSQGNKVPQPGSRQGGANTAQNSSAPQPGSRQTGANTAQNRSAPQPVSRPTGANTTQNSSTPRPGSKQTGANTAQNSSTPQPNSNTASQKPTVSTVDDIKLNSLGATLPKFLNDRNRRWAIGIAVFLIVAFLLSRLPLFKSSSDGDREDSLVMNETGDNMDWESEDTYEYEEEPVQDVVLEDDTDATPASSFTYEIYDEEVVIKAFTGAETEIVVPAVIEGKQVVRIDPGAFREQRKITSVTLKPGLTFLGDNAFADCDSLRTLVINGTELILGDGAFRNCKSLQTAELSGVIGINTQAFAECISLNQVNIPEGVTYIGREVFKNCEALTEISIPSTVTSIEDNAFNGARNLSAVTIAPGEGSAYIGNGCFRGCGSLKEISIPANYEGIGERAFSECAALQNLVVNGTGVTIWDGAFQDCKSLQTAELNGVTGIGTSAFGGCISLNQVNFSEGLGFIGREAFRDCGSLQEVALPSTITSLEESAFLGAGALTHVTMAAGEQDAYIGNNCFRGCGALAEIAIPGNYTLIGENAFRDCAALKSMVWEGSNVSYANQVIYGSAFWGCSFLGTVTLSPSLAGIEGSAFRDCISLSVMEIPENVTYVGDNAFTGCTALTRVTLPSTMEVVRNNAFRGATALREVQFGAGSLDAYIENECFRDCTSLEQVTIPGNYVNIGSDAFYNCISLTSAVWEASNAVYENQSLGDRVFRGCAGLTAVHLSSNVGTIGGDAFLDSGNVVVYAPADSAAAAYAAENGIAFAAE